MRIIVTILMLLSVSASAQKGWWLNGDTLRYVKEPGDTVQINKLVPGMAGNQGKVLSNNGTSYTWITNSASVNWGAITGTLSEQADLQSALDGKQATLVSATNIKTINGTSLLGSGDIATGFSRVFLANDVINNNATANTLADVTGLSFDVSANTTYQFRFVIVYSSAATTTGSRWTINGPATTHMSYRSQYPTSATAVTINTLAAYNSPSGANASSLTTNNRCVIEGEIRPSASGTVIARFASEISSSAITAVASGRSYVEYQIIN